MNALEALGFAPADASPVDLSEDALRAALDVAGEACDRAREEILPRYRNVAVESKGDGSPVTEADRAAERAIRDVITRAFPDDALLGEEFGESAGAAGARRWIIDPIDGTIAFTRGIPLFTTLVALTASDRPAVGVIDLPAADDRIAGARGLGAWRGTERVTVSDGPPLEDALVCHGDLFCFAEAGLSSLFDALRGAVPKLRGYTDAFGHLLVLTGAADAMIDCDLNPWDAAATRVLAAEAGGECWIRERDGGAKLDLAFGAAGTLQAIGNLPIG